MEKILQFNSIDSCLYLDNKDLNDILDIKVDSYFFDILETYILYKIKIINRNFRIEKIINKEYLKKVNKFILQEELNLYVPEDIYNFMKIVIFDCAYRFFNENIENSYTLNTLDGTINNYFKNNYEKYACIKKDGNGCKIKIGDNIDQKDYLKKLKTIK